MVFFHDYCFNLIIAVKIMQDLYTYPCVIIHHAAPSVFVFESADITLL